MESGGTGQKQITSESHHTPLDIENACTPLLNSMKEELERLSLLSSDCSIYRVQEGHRHGHERDYTPKIVSIGPLHHGKEDLKSMEEHKMWFLKAFIERTNESIGFYAELVKEKEPRLRRCYSEKIQFNSDEFVKIILVDAAFLIEVLLRFYFKELFKENDHILNRPWLEVGIWHDMILLENQLPFFILEDLYDASQKNVQSFPPEERPFILELSHHFFKTVVMFNLKGTEDQNLNVICSSKIEHLVDLLRQLHIPFKKLEKSWKLETRKIPTVTELHQAGVKFKVRSSENIFDMHFKKRILEMPRLYTGYSASVIIRNIVTFEQYFCVDHYMTDYIVLLACLVSTRKDIDLLVKYGFIEIQGHGNEGVDRIQNLVQGVGSTYDNFYFVSLCEDLNSYCRASWHEWKANLKQNYLNTPWAIISFIAAVVLLLLTLIQTVSSVISITPRGKQH